MGATGRNASLKRPVKAKTKRLWPIRVVLAVAAAVMGYALLMVRLEVTQEGYRLSALRLEIEQLRSENQRLRLEAAELSADQRLRFLAPKYGLQPPKP